MYNATLDWMEDSTHGNACIPLKNPEEMSVPWAHNPAFSAILATHSVTFVMGVAGNALVIGVMWCDKREHSATKLFLMSLAVADLLLVLVCAPLQTLQYIILQWKETGTLCKLASYVELLSPVASVLNLTAVSLERFVVIVFPMKSRSLCTTNNCTRALLAVWVVSLTLAVPVLFTKKTSFMDFCNEHVVIRVYYCTDSHGSGAQAFAIYRLLILFAFPAVLMILCYSWVIKVLWISTVTVQTLTQTNRMKPSFSVATLDSMSVIHSPSQQTVTTPEESSNKARTDDVMLARKQVIKMLILVIVLFLICWGPSLVMELLIKHGLSDFSVHVYWTRVIFYLLPFVHGCINPVIYGFMSTKFQRRLIRQCRRAFCRGRWRFKRRPTVSSTHLRRTDTAMSCARSNSTFNSSLYTPMSEYSHRTIDGGEMSP